MSVPALLVLLVLLSLTDFETHKYYAGPFAFLYRFEIAWTIAENSYLITWALVFGAWLITVPVILRAIKKDSEPTDDGLFDEEFDWDKSKSPHLLMYLPRTHSSQPTAITALFLGF